MSDKNTGNKKDIKNMANPNQNQTTVKPSTPTPAKPPAAPTPAAPPKATVPAATADAPKPAVTPNPADPTTYKGLPRLRFYSTVAGKTDYCVRILPVFLDKYGAPKDPWGFTMEQRARDVEPSKKVARIEAKEAEKAKIAKMTDEEKKAYATQKRLANQEKKLAAEKNKKLALMAELRKELEAEGMAIVPKDAVKA